MRMLGAVGALLVLFQAAAARVESRDAVPGPPFQEGDVLGIEDMDRLQGYIPEPFWARGGVRESFCIQGHFWGMRIGNRIDKVATGGRYFPDDEHRSGGKITIGHIIVNVRTGAGNRIEAWDAHATQLRDADRKRNLDSNRLCGR